MVYKFDFRCKKCGCRFTHHKLKECPNCGSFGVEVIEWTEEFKFHCETCGQGYDKTIFGLTHKCNDCYRKDYRKIKQNYADSGHFYPWNIDGSMRKQPVKVIK